MDRQKLWEELCKIERDSSYRVSFVGAWFLQSWPNNVGSALYPSSPAQALDRGAPGGGWRLEDIKNQSENQRVLAYTAKIPRLAWQGHRTAGNDNERHRSAASSEDLRRNSVQVVLLISFATYEPLLKTLKLQEAHIKRTFPEPLSKIFCTEEDYYWSDTT
jgi:hypothetical protein